MKKFSLTFILPILAIVLMKACGTGHQDAYPYRDQQELVIIDTYQEKVIEIDNHDLAKYFYDLEHSEEIEQQTQLKSIKYRGNSVEDLEAILDEHGINY